MKALLTRDLPKGTEYIYELKFDGVRALAVKDGRSTRLLSRAANELGGKYPEIVKSLAKISAKQVVLDGEVVALDEQGRPSFQVLQTYHMTSPRPPLLYYVFDALQLSGKDLRILPLNKRRAIAERLVADLSPNIRMSATIDVRHEKLMKGLQTSGLEGLVAKLADSQYETGRRSGAWLKFKWSTEQEFVIGGYTSPKGARSYFGALVIGYYEKGKLLFAGKVGTGFDQRLLSTLFAKFQKLITTECPFANLPEQSLAGRGLTRGQMRVCTWLRPELVCQVRFAEWTRDNHLRQPAFLGMRADKRATEVVRE